MFRFDRAKDQLPAMLPRLNSVLLTVMGTLGVFLALCLLHAPLLPLPYFWDEAGYYIPAALDLYRHGLLVPRSTLPNGHTPFLSVYLAVTWRLFGFSPVVTRTGLVLFAALAVVALAALGRCGVRGEGKREIILWSALSLALSPLFFAQGSLAQPEILVALFTTLAVVALLRQHMVAFAFAGCLAVLSKETAAILLPVAWVFAWQRRRERRLTAWIALALPCLLLLAWMLYYHHVTGFWTGNAEYLEFNLYSTLSPVRIVLTLLRRTWELFGAGFNWVFVLAAGLGLWTSRERRKREGKREKGDGKRQAGESSGINGGTSAVAVTVPSPLPPSHRRTSQTPNLENPRLTGDFTFLAVGLCTLYLLTLSLVGGAILPRYLLPVFPISYLVLVTLIWRLPKALARAACTLAAVCLVGSWFINPPYPFPFENNLAYADFIRLHQKAARFLENGSGAPLVLTAWPASGELTTPTLGYVSQALHVTTVRGFTFEDFANTSPESFDLLYLYSRRWEPENNWLARSALLRRIERTYFGYAPQISEQMLVDRYHLRLLVNFERDGQWVRIYTRHWSSD
jgi:4-amino-4-deoxy-L-arabinose transferase-like glycosyltransferase